jgi:signal transduction histidine kinase
LRNLLPATTDVPGMKTPMHVPPPPVESLVAEAKRAGEALRAGGLAPGDVEAACARLVEFAGHADRKVRYAVVFAAAHAPDACFEAVVPRLAKDPNGWVAKAAKGALVERTAKRKAEAALAGEAGDIAALEKKIEAADGKPALRRARELGDLREKQLARSLRHEIKKVLGALRLSVASVAAEAQSNGAACDPVVLARHAADARMTAQLATAIVETVCGAGGEPARPRYEKTEVRALVEHAVALLAARAKDPARLAVTVDVDARLSAAVDRGRVLMAFSNVLENAVEAYDDGAPRLAVHVTAREEKEGTEVTVSFRDEGCGIGAAELPHVYTPLVTSKHGGVRGLGLANVKKMIESAHGGRVRIESARGAGTTVHLTLPKEQEQEESR